MAEWYQGHSPDTTDKDATKFFEQKFGYPPFALRRDPSSVQVGPVGKRQYVVGDKITRGGQSYVVVEVEKTLAGYTILATGQDGEPNILEV